MNAMSRSLCLFAVAAGVILLAAEAGHAQVGRALVQ